MSLTSSVPWKEANTIPWRWRGPIPLSVGTHMELPEGGLLFHTPTLVSQHLHILVTPSSIGLLDVVIHSGIPWILLFLTINLARSAMVSLGNDSVTMHISMKSSSLIVSQRMRGSMSIHLLSSVIQYDRAKKTFPSFNSGRCDVAQKVLLTSPM